MIVRVLFIGLFAGLISFGEWIITSTASSPSLAAASLTLTVNRTSDASDRILGDSLCDVSVNAGDQCTLRAAIQEINAQGPSATPHRIEFDITGMGPFTITPQTELPEIEVPVEIDGTTQPGAACPTAGSPSELMIVLDGSSAGYSTLGLWLDFGSNGSTIRGMVIGNFTFAGMWIFSDGNHIECNHVGIGADGITEMKNTLIGIDVIGDGNTIGGIDSPKQRNVISGNGYEGVALLGSHNAVVNNFIGTTATGDQKVANGGVGIYVRGNDNTIGGATYFASNVISGNVESGIEVRYAGNIILGNYIGVALDGITPLGNGSDGIEISSNAIDNRVGGTASGEANRIAYNGLDGVSIPTDIFSVSLQNKIRGNSIHDNGGLGIDLGEDGVTANDAGDIDGGENELQNYPILASTPGSAVVTGILDGQPNTSYVLDAYRSESCDPSGNGEGQQYLATKQAATDGSGQAIFDINVAGDVSPGDGITATATDPNGNTSEFSNCVILSPTENGSVVFLPLVMH